MDLDITNFLPKYPNIIKEEDGLLNPYNDNFYEAIFKKKEFYDKKLPVVESLPKSPGDLMKHQHIIARFFSSRTPYDQLLLLHEMGSGKTCTSIGAIEQIKRENNEITGAMIFARGEGLLNNFTNELVFKCTSGEYIPEDYNSLTELEKVHRIKKSIKVFYELNTFETFAKTLKTMSNSVIENKYSNKIIVIDEVHNLRIQDRIKEGGISLYQQFHRFLHIVKGCKILLMSGTPMKDGPEEIASVMNLILPENEQLPVGDEFLELFFNNNGDGLFSVKPSMIDQLKSKFKGKISYLRAMQSDIRKVFEGTQLGTLNHFKVVSDDMSEFQTKIYDEAYKLDTRERSGVYNNTRQAVLFVYPDGTYGPKGFDQDRFIKKISRKRAAFTHVEGKKTSIMNYSIGTELKNLIQHEDEEQMLTNIAKYSSKYAATIRNILRSYDEGKSCFVYCEFVQGSGVILFAALLSLFGFSRANGNEQQGSEKKRYALVTNITSTQKEIRSVINRFNQTDNMYGRIINVVIGSRVIGEGFSLKNVQVENILTPHWNYSETAQAIARGWRLGSHNDLLNANVIPNVTVYQRVSIPNERLSPSIDLEMYEISEIKDINIKRVEVLMKESAFDCALNYDRNYHSGYDGERECDYGNCTYTCDGIPTDLLVRTMDNSELDYSTYQLYYAGPNIINIANDIVKIFRNHFNLDLDTIISLFPSYSRFEIISALRTVINESKVITNKYGFPSYLKEENNIFFLVDSLSVVGDYSSKYYTKNPNVYTHQTFSKIINKMKKDSYPRIVRKFCGVKSDKELQSLIVKLPLQIQEDFIEGSLLAREQNIQVNVQMRDLILEYFKKFYQNINGIWVSKLLYEDTDILRCMKNLKWEDCEEEYVGILGEERGKKREQLEQNPYGYYGIYNRELDQFCIRDVSGDVGEKDQRKIPSGRRCVNWDRAKLTQMVIDVIALDPPEKNKYTKQFKGKSRTALLKASRENKYLSVIFPPEREDSLSDEDLRRGLYWAGKQRKFVCEQLLAWFRNQDLYIEDSSCGTHQQEKNIDTKRGTKRGTKRSTRRKSRKAKK